MQYIMDVGLPITFQEAEQFFVNVTGHGVATPTLQYHAILKLYGKGMGVGTTQTYSKGCELYIDPYENHGSMDTHEVLHRSFKVTYAYYRDLY